MTTSQNLSIIAAFFGGVWTLIAYDRTRSSMFGHSERETRAAVAIAITFTVSAVLLALGHDL